LKQEGKGAGRPSNSIHFPVDLELKALKKEGKTNRTN